MINMSSRVQRRCGCVRRLDQKGKGIGKKEFQARIRKRKTALVKSKMESRDKKCGLREG